MANYKFKDDKKNIVIKTETRDEEINIHDLERNIRHRETGIAEATAKLDELKALRDEIKTALDFSEPEKAKKTAKSEE